MTNKDAILNAKVETPLYIVDEALLIKNLELIQRVQQLADINILCALKGFSMHHYFPLLKQYISGASASSLHEALLINEKMLVKAHTYLPAYKNSEINQLAKLSDHLIFNSLGQFHQFNKDVLAANPDCSLGLRLNPEYSEVTTELYNPCSPNSRLGVKQSGLPEFLPKEIEGFHFHALCENDSYVFERLLIQIEKKFSKYFEQLKWINFGGGHLMTRSGYDIDHLVSLLKNFKSKYHLDVYLEPGSAFAWETGYLMATVLDIIDNGENKIAILDTSFTCHMPDCLEMPYRPKVYGENVNGQYKYIFGGSSCLSGDQMANFAFDNALKIGQRILFEDMIHYTMVKTTTFNGIHLPGIASFSASNGLNIIQSFGYNEFKQRLS